MSNPKQPSVLATDLVLRFRCVGAECEDTCCAGWAIDVDDVTRKKYESKSDLAHSFEVTGHGNYMRSNSSGMCVKNREGWCNIVEKYGDDYLSNTCYFFPRSLRRIGTQSFMAATLSCPEITRMVLQDEGTFERQEYPLGRGKILGNALPQSLAQEDALAIHAMIQASLNDVSLSPAQHIRRLIALAVSLDEMEKPGWSALARLHMHTPPPLPPMPLELNAAMQLLHGFAKMTIFSQSQYQKRVYATLREMEMALEARLHWKEALLDYSQATSETAWQNIRQAWTASYAPALAPVLHRWLAAQVARNVYPFAGLGENPCEQAFELAINYATLQLALMCACHRCGHVPDDDELRRIVQSVARVLESQVDIQIFYQAYDIAPSASQLLGLFAE